MKNSLILTIMLLLNIMIFSCEEAFSQLPINTFSISAGFNEDGDDIGFGYSISKNFEIGAGAGLSNISYSVSEGEAPESETIFGAYIYADYYLYKGDYVSPYIGLSAFYWVNPTDNLSNGEITHNEMGVRVYFGANAFITEGIALWTDLGIKYTIEDATYKPDSGSEISSTENILKLVTHSIGASFYFN